MAARIEPRLSYPPAAGGSTTKIAKRIKTIVADDSDTFLEALCDVLDLEDDIEVVAAASNGAEALHQAARLKPALVLMDVQMPELDGVSAASLMAEIQPSPIVVLMSSEDTSELREQCRRAGAFAFVHKVYLQQEFPEIVERILKLRDQHWMHETA